MLISTIRALGYIALLFFAMFAGYQIGTVAVGSDHVLSATNPVGFTAWSMAVFLAIDLTRPGRWDA